MTDLGVPADAAQAWLAQQSLQGDEESGGDAGEGGGGGQPLLIWPENLPVWRVWLCLQTQWRYWPRGGLQGLRLDQADVVIRRMGLADGDTVFAQLIEMEHAALEAWYGEQH